MNSKKIRDLKKVIKREKTFSTEARQEGRGAADRAKKETKSGLRQSAADSRQEKKIDNYFAEKRKKKVIKLEKKLNKELK